ncbi:MAG: hypothetical protein ACK4NQ_10420 [Fimbriimonadaceae bacterium]
MLAQHCFHLVLLLGFNFQHFAQEVGTNALHLKILVHQGVVDELPCAIAHNALTLHLIAVDFKHALRGLISERTLCRIRLGG